MRDERSKRKYADKLERRRSWIRVCESEKLAVRDALRRDDCREVYRVATQLLSDAWTGVCMRVGAASTFRGYSNYAMGVLR